MQEFSENPQRTPPVIIKVEAYSGYRADERPKTFTIGEKVLKVESVLDRWYGEDHDYFKGASKNYPAPVSNTGAGH